MATVVGDTITLSGAAGAVTVRARQPGNAHYLPAEEILRTFYVLESGPGLVGEGNTLSFTGTGTGEVSVTASQAGDADFEPAPDVTRTFEVITPRTAYDRAAQQAGLAGNDALPEAIPFDDGINNLVKYAFKP